MSQDGQVAHPATRPMSVLAASWLVGAMILVHGVAAALTILLDDDLVNDWSAGHAASEAVEPPAFVAVAVVMFVVIATLAIVLLRFFHARLAWARAMLTGLLAVVVIGTVSLLLSGPPALFLVVLLVSLLIDLAALVALWHPDTSGYLAHPA